MLASSVLIFFHSFSVATYFPDTNKLSPKMNIRYYFYRKENREKYFHVARTDEQA